MIKHKRSLVSVAMAALMLVSLVAVASATSVSAADGGKGNVQTSGAPVGAPLGSAPAVIEQWNHNVEVFAKGADNALWWKKYDSAGWSGWKSLGGYITSDPAVVQRDNGYWNVFVRGGSGYLNSIWTGDGGNSWHGWYTVGGKQLLEGTGPAAASFGPNRCDWFITCADDHALYHMWDDSAGRHGWDNLGGYLTSSPGATAYGPNIDKIAVFGRGSLGGLWATYYINGGWSGLIPLGGGIRAGTGPAACSWILNNRLDVFVTGDSGAVYHIWSQQGVPWSNWADGKLIGSMTSSPGAAASAAPGGADQPPILQIDVFGGGGNGHLWQDWYNSQWYTGWWLGFYDVSDGPP
jgi:hypothetical protein